MTAAGKGIFHPMQNETQTVFGHHANVDPALALDPLGTPDVVHVPLAIGAVLPAVMVEANQRFVVSHIDECLPDAVGHPYLGSRRGQSGVDEEEPQPRFLR